MHIKRATWETRDEGGQGHGEDNAVAELRTAVGDFTTAAEQRLAAAEASNTELRGRLERLETTSRRPGTGATEQRDQGNEVERRAFNTFLRRGPQQLDAVETRTLRVSDDTAGGYLAPDQFVAELLRNVVRFSPVRSIARVMSTSSGAVLLPKRTGTMTAQWVGETQTRPATTVVFGQERFTVREISCYVDVSNQLLEDAAIDLVAELSFDFAEEFGRAEGQAFVSGDGVLRPFGLMSDTTIPYVPSGSSTSISGSEVDAFIAQYMALAPAYRANGTWGMNANTLAALLTLKTSQGNYLLSMQGVNNAPSPMLLGRPVVEMVDMPDIATNSFPIIFGDFSNYRIFDRVALSVLRDPYSQAVNGITRFYGRRRVAGGVAKSEAFVKMKIATS